MYCSTSLLLRQAIVAAPPLQAIRSDDSEVTKAPLHVDVDTLTFDRVLLFLECSVCGQEVPMWSLHLIDDLARVSGSWPFTYGVAASHCLTYTSVCVRVSVCVCYMCKFRGGL